MAAFDTETVLAVHHWNESLFRLRDARAGHALERSPDGRLEVNGKPPMRLSPSAQ
jgi:hypothetical protein